MLHEAVAFTLFLRDIFHPLRGWGYQFWSGIAGSFVLGGGMWVGLFTYLRRHNCHVHRCLRLAWAEHPNQPGHFVCKKHHPHDPRDEASMRGEHDRQQ